MKCTTEFFDIHNICSIAAALLAVGGLILSFSAVNVVATYCMWVYAMYPRLIVHEITAMVLAGFVLGQTTGEAQLLFGASYILFITSVGFQWLHIIENRIYTTSERTSQPEPTPPVNVNDI